MNFAIDLEQEKTRTLSSQDVFDILNFATQAADIEGFVNSYVFDRAILCYAAITLYPERKEEIAESISRNIFDTWDMLVEDGTIEEMDSSFSKDIDFISSILVSWKKEYAEYAVSARGLLDSIGSLAADLFQDGNNQFIKSMRESGAASVLEIADKWGLNNELPEGKDDNIPEDSVFEK